MELTTFTMVLRFTLQLEDQTAQFYRGLASRSNLSQAKDLFTKFAESSERRKKDLERTARESVDHSLLEPVSGIFEETYAANLTVSENATIRDAVSAATALEERMGNFYSEAGEKINFISNVARLYKRYAQDRAKSLKSLQDFS
jgi:rubrerythrin